MVHAFERIENEKIRRKIDHSANFIVFRLSFKSIYWQRKQLKTIANSIERKKAANFSVDCFVFLSHTSNLPTFAMSLLDVCFCFRFVFVSFHSIDVRLARGFFRLDRACVAVYYVSRTLQFSNC